MSLASRLSDLTTRIATEFNTVRSQSLLKSGNLSGLVDLTVARSNLGLGSIATQNANSVAITGGTIAGLTSFRTGANAGSTYLIEHGQNYTGLNTDRSIMRVQGTASRATHGGGEFWGLTGIRVDMTDAAGVDNTTDPYLYAFRARLSLRAARTQTGIEDVCGICVTNKSYDDFGTTFSGTEAIYIGKSSDPAKTQEWNTGIGIETSASNGIYLTSGPFNYGILMTGATFTTAALRFPNNTPIVSRNAADDTNIVLMKVDTSNRLSIKSDTLVLDTLGNVLVNTTSPNLIGGGKGFQIRSTDGTTVEINASADTAASATAAIYAKGRSGSNDVVGRLQAQSGGTIRMGGESSGHNVEVRQGGQTRILMTATSMTLFDPYDIGLGTATGTKLGTLATQKLGFWGATPIVRPTGWAAATGTATRTTFATSTATLTQVAERLKALIDDLLAEGLIGA